MGDYLCEASPKGLALLRRPRPYGKKSGALSFQMHQHRKDVLCKHPHFPPSLPVLRPAGIQLIRDDPSFPIVLKSCVERMLGGSRLVPLGCMGNNSLCKLQQNKLPK